MVLKEVRVEVAAADLHNQQVKLEQLLEMLQVSRDAGCSSWKTFTQSGNGGRWSRVRSFEKDAFTSETINLLRSLDAACRSCIFTFFT